jgi:thiosulfate reductase cytochrome b subunit
MKLIYLHPLPLRIWHWANAFIVVLLIATGLYLRIHGIAALKPHDPILTLHKFMGFMMIIATFFWFVYNMSNKNLRRHYRIGRQYLKGIFPQIEYYLFSIFAGKENPHKASAGDKYNPLQKIAYNAVMFIFLPVQEVTGLLFMGLSVFMSGSLIGFICAIHVIFSYLLVLYLIVHLYMSTLGDTFFSHTKTMITGYKDHGDAINENK